MGPKMTFTNPSEPSTMKRDTPPRMLKHGSPSSLLLLLGAAGFALLWGVSLCNGTVDALLLIQQTRVFPDGRPLRASYTGLTLIDRSLGILVAFFDVLTNDKSAPLSFWLCFDLCALLASINTWVVIEGRRNGVKRVWLRHAAIAIFLWNSLGAAFIAPLYFYLIVKSDHAETIRDAIIPLNKARGLLPTAVANFLFPLVMFFLPTWLGWSSHDHQGFIALFSLSPVCMMLVLSLFNRSLHPRGLEQNGPNEGTPWIIASLYTTGILSGLVHLYIVAHAILGTSTGLSIWNLFVPDFSKVSGAEIGSYAALQKGVHLFTQFDWWVTAAASVVFVGQLLGKVSGDPRSVKTVICIAIASFIVGPGAAGSFALVAREVRLRKVETSNSK